MKQKGKGNLQVSIRITPMIESKLNEGMIITGLNRADFTRLAIIEKAEREIVKIENLKQGGN